jgi:uncharacterized protein (DUF885 family)
VAALLPLATLALALLAAGCASAPAAAPAAAPAPPPRTITGAPQDPRLAAIMDAVWQRQIEDSLFFRQKLGLPIDKLPRFTFAQTRDDARFAGAQLRKLAELDEGTLSHDDRLSVGMLRYELRAAVDAVPFHWLTFPITPYASPLPGIHQVFTGFEFDNADDLARYERLLGQYARLLRDIQLHLDTQLRRGIVLPQPELQVVVPFLQSFVADGEDSLFYVSQERLAGLAEQGVDGERLATFQQQVGEQIDGTINPLFQHLLFFLANEYERRAPEDLGLAQYPNGDAYYDYLVRLHTTLDLTPEEIHQRGLTEVERIEAAMAKLQVRLGNTGPPSEFRSMLRNNQRLKATSSEQIGERLMEYVAKIEPRIGELFLRLPAAPYGVQALPDGLAGAMTYGYYQSPTSSEPTGYYLYNGSQPEQRSLLWAQSLIYHELVPGHHFQLGLQYENEAAHPLRRFNPTTAFTEGWAEYASELGNDLGLYEGLDRYGRYVAEIFLASRLVVDTGIHRYGWSRERALQYMQEHTMESPVQLGTEVLRYGIDIPGQALAYKIGALQIQQWRAEAQAALGDGFDIRRFHDALLEVGALPLPVVGEHVHWWIEQEQARLERTPAEQTP